MSSSNFFSPIDSLALTISSPDTHFLLALHTCTSEAIQFSSPFWRIEYWVVIVRFQLSVDDVVIGGDIGKWYMDDFRESSQKCPVNGPRSICGCKGLDRCSFILDFRENHEQRGFYISCSFTLSVRPSRHESVDLVEEHDRQTAFLGPCRRCA